MKKDPRQEAARLRQDWEREKGTLELTLRQIQEGLSKIDLSIENEDLQQLVLFEKSLRENIEERETILRALERNSCILSQEEKLNHSYQMIEEISRWATLCACGLISHKDLDDCDISSEIPLVGQEKLAASTENEHSQFIKALFLEFILTSWQAAAAKIIERELLQPRRIGSICFISEENGLLGMKLALMARIGLISSNETRLEFFRHLLAVWGAITRNFHVQFVEETRPSLVINSCANKYDALFLDYGILSILEQQYPTYYLDFMSGLETHYPFLILLLKKSQVEFHQKALKNMQLESYSLISEDASPHLLEDDISTLCIARRRSRYILHSARDPWDILVRDFGWNRSKSLDNPSPAYQKNFPNPFHLSEKILIASHFAIRVVSTSRPDQPSCTWLSQREAAYWKKFGGKIPEIPHLLSEKRSPTHWKFVLQLGQGNWTFARSLPSPPHLLAQTESLLQALIWFRKQNLFINNIRLDTLAIHGPEIRILSLERVGSKESEDTLSSLLWFWYDLGRVHLPLRPWPIEYFPDETLASIPSPLQKIAQFASLSGTLDSFLEHLPPLS